MMPDDKWFEFVAKMQAQYGRYYCRPCADKMVEASGHERYSMGVYAGMYCDGCWEKNSLNHDREFDPMDAGEAYEPEDY